MQLGAANYKWMVFIHYRRPSRKVSLLSNTMLIWVWLSKVIKLLWIKRFFKRGCFPVSPSLHARKFCADSFLALSELSCFSDQWEPVLLVDRCYSYSQRMGHLCLFPFLFTLSVSALQHCRHISPLLSACRICLCFFVYAWVVSLANLWLICLQVRHSGSKRPQFGLGPKLLFIPAFTLELWVGGGM